MYDTFQVRYQRRLLIGSRGQLKSSAPSHAGKETTSKGPSDASEMMIALAPN